MGALVRCDSRLVDLWSSDPGRSLYALALAQTQADTLANRGHLLALNDEYVWRRILAYQGSPALPRITVRCQWCYASAGLPRWWLDRALRPDQAIQRAQERGLVPSSAAASYLYQCPGEDTTLRLIDALARAVGAPPGDDARLAGARGEP